MGIPARDVRVLAAAIHTLGTGSVLLFMAFFPPATPVAATVLLTVACGMAGVSHSSYWANMLDLAPTQAGVLLGVSNTIATVPGMLGNAWAGYALEQHNSWAMVWLSCVVFNVLGFVVFWLFCRAEPIWR